MEMGGSDGRGSSEHKQRGRDKEVGGTLLTWRGQARAGLTGVRTQRQDEAVR
jgi:hypothetical protein